MQPDPRPLVDILKSRLADAEKMIYTGNLLKMQAEAALAAIAGINDDVTPTPKVIRQKAKNQKHTITIKAMILDVLGYTPSGASAEEIIRAIKVKFDKDIPRSSMSPQLTRLKKSGDVVREDGGWMLPKFASGNSYGASTPANDQQDDNMADEQDRHTQGEDANGAMPRMSEEGQAFDLGG